MKKESFKSTIVNGIIKKIEKIDTNHFFKNPDFMFKLEITNETKPILTKIEKNSIPLKKILYISKGVEVYERDSGKTKKEFIFDSDKEGKYKKYLEAKEADKYAVHWMKRFLNYQPKKHCSGKFPELFENPKIIMKRILGKERITATIDLESFYVENTIICLVPKEKLATKFNFDSNELELSKKYDLRFILGILNSKPMGAYFKIKFGDKLQIYNRAIEELPIPKENISNQNLNILVDKIISLNKQLNELGDKKTDEREKIEEEIKKTDKEIDEFVYKIYGITDEEKKIIEESLQ